MKALRVCHLGKYYPPAPGGIETHVRTLARAQAALGASVRVFGVNHQLRAALFRPFERLVYRKVRWILPSSPTYPGGSPFLRAYADRLQVLPMGIDLKPYLEPTADDRARAAEIRARHAGNDPLW